MSTSRRGHHVESLPANEAAPTVPEDADDLEPDVISEVDEVDAEPLLLLRMLHHLVKIRQPPQVRPFE